jgi:hypothetical protein
MINLTETLFPQPTLALYLGGTGVEIGKQLLLQREPLDQRDRASIEALFFDSQEPNIVDHSHSLHCCYTNLDQFFQPIYQDFADRRFPENLGVPVINSSEGCGVTRIYGAASLVACRDEFMDLVDSAVLRLKDARRMETQPLQVFITASSCGGTGAGMILDAAALVRHYFRSRHENPRIFLFLVGPTAYSRTSMREDQRDRMRASTYALIKELNHFADGNEFVSSYRLRDQQIRISNVADDDRLFDWVYFIEGRGERSVTRTIEDVEWTVAEAQMHLAMTEVGRKVAESMPNQREERLRGYAQNFIHPDNKDHLSDATLERLKTSSRRTFLASFAVRNVRFPAADVKKFLRARWVRDALHKALQREDPTPDIPSIDQFDAILGYVRGAFTGTGLFADVGLTSEQLSSQVSDDADPQRGVPAAPPTNAIPDRAVRDAEQLMAAAEWALADMKGSAALLPGSSGSVDHGRMLSTAALIARAVPRWNEIWRVGLAETGRISERLLQLAWAPAGGRGLRFLDDLLVHASNVLTSLAAKAKERPSFAELEERIAAVGGQLAVVRTTRQREHRGAKYIVRSIASRFIKQISPDSENLVNRTHALVAAAAALRQQLVEERARHLAAVIAPEAWLLATRQLKRWRDEFLSPTITAADNAFTLAENRRELARQALETYRGVNQRGEWEALSTIQLAGDDLLNALSARIRMMSVEDLVLVPLQEEGISRERERLTIHTLRTIARETTVDMIAAHVDAHTRGQLTFLDNGWMIDEVRRHLHTTAARDLDSGSEPLTGFSRPAIGVQLQSYLLVHRDLVLPNPFGLRLSRMNRLTSCDPLQLGVVSFVFGIPPNALDGMHELFEQYTNHIGDQLRNKAHDRFPLHVFRDAAEGFDEPHSPLTFQTNDELVRSLFEAAHELWGHRIKLDIRELDPSDLAHRRDWNRYIELTEKLLRSLARSPKDAERLFGNGRYPDLERLYNTRCHRSAAAWGPDGNNHEAAKERPEGDA